MRIALVSVRVGVPGLAHEGAHSQPEFAPQPQLGHELGDVDPDVAVARLPRGALTPATQRQNDLASPPGGGAAQRLEGHVVHAAGDREASTLLEGPDGRDDRLVDHGRTASGEKALPGQTCPKPAHRCGALAPRQGGRLEQRLRRRPTPQGQIVRERLDQRTVLRMRGEQAAELRGGLGVRGPRTAEACRPAAGSRGTPCPSPPLRRDRRRGRPRGARRRAELPPEAA